MIVRTRGWLLCLSGCLLLSGCTATFVITPTSRQGYSASSSVELLTEQSPPRRPFVIIASFRGSESKQCSPGEPYCSLTARARKLGADAVWIQHADTQTYPGEWKEIQGRLTQIRAFSTEIVSGVLLRYTDSSQDRRDNANN